MYCYYYYYFIISVGGKLFDIGIQCLTLDYYPRLRPTFKPTYIVLFQEMYTFKAVITDL